MLSHSLKRNIPMTRHHHNLRKTIDSKATSSMRQQRRSGLTTAAASSSTKQQKSHVISRRAWLDFKESHVITKKRPDPSKRPKSDDEKPWPRNMQIAGYLAGALAVPYTVLWTITSNPTLREYFGPYIPLDKLRTHFGKLEWDARSYSEEMEDTENKEITGNDESQLSIGYYQFPEEVPYNVRRQQEVVESMNESDVSVAISLSSSSSSIPEEIVTTKIAAKTIANSKNLLHLFPSTLATTDEDKTVAVHFLDKNLEGNDTDNMTESSAFGASDTTMASPYEATMMTDADSMGTKKIREHGGPKNYSQESWRLRKDIQTASKWAYVPQAAGEGSKDGANNSSNASKTPQLTKLELEMSRLQYEISELEMNLKNPMCTRSIDDMTTELRQAKRDLSRLKWKNRFGLA